MAIGYFKSFKPEDAIQTTFVANKQWTISDDGLDTGIIADTGSLITGSNYHLATFTTASQNGFSSGSTPTEPVTSGRYNFIVHSSIDQMFYRFAQKGIQNDSYGRPCQWMGTGRETRELHKQAHVISIPQSIYGEGIKRNSVIVYDQPTGIRLKDDGYTNLIDPSITTSSLGDENLVIHVPFNEGYKYKVLPNIPRTQGRHHGKKPGLHYNGPYGHNVATHLVKYEEGKRGYALNLQGVTGSYAIIKKDDNSQTQYGTEQDFAISMWLKIPESQSISQSRWGSFENWKDWNVSPQIRYNIKRRKLKQHMDNLILSKKVQAWSSRYPFEISIGNSWGSSKGSYDGKIIFRRSDGVNEKFMVSAEKYNDNTWKHFVFQKTGSNLEMYCNGNRIGFTGDFTSNSAGGSVVNNAPITIGAGRVYDAYDSRLLTSNTDLHDMLTNYGVPMGVNTKTKYKPIEFKNYQNIIYDKTVETMVQPFKGSIDEIRIYNQAIPSASILALSSSITNNQIVGNVFYDYGIVTVTDPSPRYKNMFAERDKHYVTFKGKHTIREEEYYCHIKSDDFDVSMNPTLRKNNSSLETELKGMASASEFSPYITTVGLYNNNFELMATGKLAQPVKKAKNMDTTIVVRFDR